MHRLTLFFAATTIAATAFAGGVLAVAFDGEPDPAVGVDPAQATGPYPTEAPPTEAPPTTAPPTITAPEPESTVAPTTTAPPSTTVAPEPDPEPETEPVAGPVERRTALMLELVDALNDGDLNRLEALTAADPRSGTLGLPFLVEFAPYWFEYCFEVANGVPKCNAASEGFGLTIGFTDDDTAIALVDGAYNDGQ